MKTSIKIAALTALTLSAGQALAFETEVERVGMLYLNIPLSNRTSAPTIDKSVMGFRFGQTRLSTDRAGSLFTYFRTRPALFDVQFGMVGRINAPDDIRFGLLDLKLTGISAVEKTYINGSAVVGGVVASKLLMGGLAVGGIGMAAAASGGGSSSDSDNSNDATSHEKSSHDKSSSHEEGDSHDQVAEIEHENEVEHEDDHDKNEIDHEDDDKAEIGHDDQPGHDNDDDHVIVVIAPVVTVVVP